MMTDRLLSELAPSGFFELELGVIVRARGALREGLFLQMSSPRSQQTVCATAGIDVPGAARSAESPQPHFGATVGGRLSERGIGYGDLWLRVETADDVALAADRVLSLLNENAGWFEQFREIRDVAQAYFESHSLLPLGKNDYWKQLAVFHYARMMLAAGDRAVAIEWLQETDRVIRSGERLDKDDQVVLAQVAALLQSEARSS